MKEIDRSIFWDMNRTLTHNALFNFILGGRGCGKSYGAKKRCIDNFIKKREQFGYIRRYKDDLKKPLEQFFKDVAWEYPDYEFKVEGDKLYIRLKPADEKQKWTPDDIAGYGFQLSTANNKKSISYPDITTLIFDEFLIEKGNVHYLQNEPEKLLNLYETVARPGTGHPRVILFMLANAVSITNPYFLYFNLRMPKQEDRNGKLIWKHPKKSILVENVKNKKFEDVKRNTDFGGIIEGTAYADYSIDNKFLLDDDSFIERKTATSRYYFTFMYRDRSFGVWIDFKAGKMFVSEDVDPYYPINYAITLADHKPNTMLSKNLSKHGYLKMFVENFKMGNVYFENMNVKNLSYEVLKMVLS